MTYSELVRIKPSLRAAPYIGAIDVVNGDTVRYYLDPRPRDPDFDDSTANVPNPRARVVGIERWSRLQSDSKADSIWVKRIATFLKPIARLTCYELDWGTQKVVAAYGQDHLGWMGSVRMSGRVMRGSTGDLKVPPISTLFVALDPNTIIPSGVKKNLTKCPTGD